MFGSLLIEQAIDMVFMGVEIVERRLLVNEQEDQQRCGKRDGETGDIDGGEKGCLLMPRTTITK